MAKEIIDLQKFRNRHHVFHDRSAAGVVLAEMLAEYADRKDALVLAIPSGGVPVGLELADRLNLNMDLLITRKIQIPGNTEAGFGAVAMDGRVLFNEELLARLHLSSQTVEEQVEIVRRQLHERNSRFRNNRPMPVLHDRTVILTDDGLASGYTMLAAIATVAAQSPASVLVAVPTAPITAIERLPEEVQRVYCPNMHGAGAFAVAAAYEVWRDLEANEVEEMLGLHHSPKPPPDS